MEGQVVGLRLLVALVVWKGLKVSVARVVGVKLLVLGVGYAACAAVAADSELLLLVVL